MSTEVETLTVDEPTVLGAEVWGNRVLLKQLPAEEKVGSIIIPTTAQEKSLFCTVVGVGPGKENMRTIHEKDSEGNDVERQGIFYVPINLEIGDVVLIGQHSGIPVTLPGDKTEYKLTDASEILLLIEQTEAD